MFTWDPLSPLALVLDPYRSPYRASHPQDMLRLVHYVANTVCKWAVGILLKCLLVTRCLYIIALHQVHKSAMLMKLHAKILDMKNQLWILPDRQMLGIPSDSDFGRMRKFGWIILGWDPSGWVVPEIKWTSDFQVDDSRLETATSVVDGSDRLERPLCCARDGPPGLPSGLWVYSREYKKPQQYIWRDNEIHLLRLIRTFVKTFRVSSYKKFSEVTTSPPKKILTHISYEWLQLTSYGTQNGL